MSWIKENKFLSGLIGGTLLGVIGLYLLGSSFSTSYDGAKEAFDAAAGEVSGFERSPLYPSDDNENAKSKALDEYKTGAEQLQAAFDPFRPKEISNISPQEFGNQVVKVNEDLRKGFADANVTFPDAFFCGFETYKTNPAAGDATGILGYQLDSVKFLIEALTKSGVSELKNLHRPALPEELGKEFMPADEAVARALPLEITFSGPEKAIRAFMTAISKPDERFFVVRSLRISNQKKDPPKTADAKFEEPKPAAANPALDLFQGGFDLPPSEEEEKAEDSETPKEAAPAPEPEPAPAADSARILAQVLGNEEVQVFLRLDLMQFLPAKKLP